MRNLREILEWAGVIPYAHDQATTVLRKSLKCFETHSQVRARVHGYVVVSVGVARPTPCMRQQRTMQAGSTMARSSTQPILAGADPAKKHVVGSYMTDQDRAEVRAFLAGVPILKERNIVTADGDDARIPGSVGLA